MSARAVGSGCILLALTWPVFLALAQGPRPQAVSPPAMATVGTRRIERADYERRLAVAREQATARGSERPAEFKDLLRRQMLESMIRLNLLVLEARRQGIAPSGAEAESVLRRDPFFSPGGTFDAQRWRAASANAPLFAMCRIWARR